CLSVDWHKGSGQPHPREVEGQRGRKYPGWSGQSHRWGQQILGSKTKGVPMDFNDMFNFLEKLQANNNKAWMDANRKWYRSLRGDFILWLDGLDMELSQLHEGYYPTPG